MVDAVICDHHDFVIWVVLEVWSLSSPGICSVCGPVCSSRQAKIYRDGTNDEEYKQYSQCSQCFVLRGSITPVKLTGICSKRCSTRASEERVI